MKRNIYSKSLSKSTGSFFPKNDGNLLKDQNELNGNEEKRREAIRENLKKMISLKKENHIKAKEILVT